MKDDTSIIRFRQPEAVEDPLTEIAREGARRMLATALEAEIGVFLDQVAGERWRTAGSAWCAMGTVRSGRSKPGSGRSPSGVPRSGTARRTPAIRCGSHPSILPRWARRSLSLDVLLPVLYLRGISTGDFQEALAALLGAGRAEPVAGRHLAADRRLGAGARPLAAPRSLCTALRLHLGRRRLPAGPDGARGRVHPRRDRGDTGGQEGTHGLPCRHARDAQSWRELLVDLKARGLAVAPRIAVGDGALGFWKALDEVFPGTAHQRCWVHKAANVLNKVPKSMAPTVKSDLRDIWQAETRAAAEAAIETFAEKYGTKYGKAVACLTKDRDALLGFYDFPAEHWDHLRTANPIESVFATVRHRTVRTKGALSQKTAKLMVFTLVRAAEKKWRRLNGANQLPRVVDGITFTDGVALRDPETRAA